MSDQRGSKNLNTSQLHGKCGIITACLIDPLSQLINKISGRREDDVNAVGFYYEANLHGVNKCIVILFNTYDNDPIPWLRLGYTMSSLLASPFVTKICYHQLITSDKDASKGPLLSRNAIPNGRRTSAENLEETFRIAVVHIIGTNAKAIHDKNTSYTALLFKIAGITGEDADRLYNQIITGYSLVNRVLIGLMGIDKVDPVKISSSIINCPLIMKPKSIIAPRDEIDDDEVKFVIEESRREITKLAAIFVDLFTTHEEFRTYVLTARINKPVSQITNVSLDKLMSHEFDLISHITGGLQNGFVSNKTLIEIIRDIISERFNLGNYQQLPICLNPKPMVQVSNESMACTFQQSAENINHLLNSNFDALRDLGGYISHLVESFNNNEVLTVNLGGMIAAYNNAVKGTSVNEISIPLLGSSNTLSRSAVVTIPGNSNDAIIKIPASQTLVIPMYNSNLTIFTETQLIDILVYIDSLRSPDGITDTRFANLQNEITHELALRKRSEISNK